MHVFLDLVSPTKIQTNKNKKNFATQFFIIMSFHVTLPFNFQLNIVSFYKEYYWPEMCNCLHLLYQQTYLITYFNQDHLPSFFSIFKVDLLQKLCLDFVSQILKLV